MDRLAQAYSPEAFRRAGHALIDQLADHLAADRSMPAITYRAPDELLAEWQQRLAQPTDDPLAVFGTVLEQSVHLHHPRYMGHQISPPLPTAALAGLVSDLLNNGMGVYEMGMAGTAIEQVVVQRVAQQLGFGAEAGGFLTSGGTLANVTALLTARSLRATQPVWTQGHTAPLALLVSEAAHYCVDRAVRIMGWGEAGIIRVPVDADYRMRTDLLPHYLYEAQARGIQVVAVVGSACSTATGSFDDLPALADFAEEHGLWLHVDGAHGAALAFSEQYRTVVAGIERADSVTLDFHKMLLTPSITTALVYRRSADSYRTFQQRASYLLSDDGDERWYDLAARTFECTKLMLGLKAYAVLMNDGAQLLNEYVTRVCDLGQTLARLVAATPGMELAVLPACNIVCFRYRPAERMTVAEENALTAATRQALLNSGNFYLVQTELNGTLWLRTTLTNPFTTEADLQELLNQVRAEAARWSGVEAK